ncbi:dihydroorotase [Boudabousia tangfeifanii]|uniref:Dihydroorotase n=1 Tax=Boudabousia tangfeifanii TaxID=1912795 RepID=A0A1D9MJU9_9ACTO|nr:dihydroorotase [Boudabousia tangfeifanii]AOZ72621.1 dihydroorotase [Boudabousia tangfeifanii]
MNNYVFTGAQILDGPATDIAIQDGKIVALGEDAKDFSGPRIDAGGLVALPGLVDLHCHLRQPGMDAAETVYTGTRAAAAGGYTCVYAMANTNPVGDNALVIEKVLDLGEAAGFVEVRPIGAVSKGLEGKSLSAMGSMAASRAKVRVFSDDGKCVSDSALMRRALEYAKGLDAVIAQHAQEPTLTATAQMNEGVVSGELGLAGWPAAAEESIIARDILLAKHLDARVHVCHLSTAGSVELVRWAKAQGIKITAEATPHHLSLSEELARTFDPRYKVNPPLRTQADIEAVRDGLADGTIDIVGTDHAPHPAATKECPWDEAAFGMTGLETALPIIIKTMVQTGRMNWADVARVLSYTPARIGSNPNQGLPIAVGNPANLALVDPTVVRVVNPDEQYTKSRNCPYIGMELPGQVMYTAYRGKLTVKAGKVQEDQQ